MRRAMPVANARLRAAIPPGLPVGDLLHADAATLLAVLSDKRKSLVLRSVAAIRLADCRTNPAVAMTLAQVLGNGHEASSLRGIAVVSLGNLGGPIAAEALKKVVLNRADAKLEAPNGKGGKMPFATLAALALEDFPLGKEALRQILRFPQDYGVAWATALFALYSDDPSTMIRLASDVVRGAHQPLELRQAAVETLGLALQDWQDAGGWDLLVSVSLAKSEPESLRRLANQALQKRPK